MLKLFRIIVGLWLLGSLALMVAALVVGRRVGGGSIPWVERLPAAVMFLISAVFGAVIWMWASPSGARHRFSGSDPVGLHEVKKR